MGIELQDAILAELQYSKRAWTAEELADRLEQPQNLIVTTLHNLRNGHLVERTPDGRWKLLPIDELLRSFSQPKIKDLDQISSG